MKTKFHIIIKLILLTAIITGIGTQRAFAGHSPLSDNALGKSLAPPPNTPDDSRNVELVRQIGGATYAVAIQGNYAYIGEGARLTILNISDPHNPAVVGKTSLMQAVVRDVAVSGDYAYVADGSSLRVIDVSAPSNPTEAGYYDTPGDAYGVAVSGNTLT